MASLQTTRTLTPVGMSIPHGLSRVPERSRWWLALGGIFVLQLLLSAWMPAVDDELYYWTWAKHLSASYYDHPPLVAYFIAFSTAIFGDTVFAIRLPACILAWITLSVVAALSGRRALLFGVLICPIYCMGSILMTPDAPLLAAWALYIAWLVSVCERLSHWNGDPVSRVYQRSPISVLHWSLGGILLGLGFLSKYTMAITVPCSLFVLMTQTRWSAWWKGYLWHLTLALLVFVPVLLFNYQHGFEPFLFQWNHAKASMIGGGFWGFVASQWILIGFLPFLLTPWVLICLPELLPLARYRVFSFFFLFPFAFFLFQAIRHGAEANWGFPAYLAFWPLAQHLLEASSFPQMTRIFAFATFLPAWITTAVACVHFFVFPIPYLTAEKDRMAQYGSKAVVARQAVAMLKEKSQANVVYATSYQWASQLSFAGATAYQIPNFHRKSHFTYLTPPPCAQSEVWVMRELGEQFSSLTCFAKQESVHRFAMIVKNRTLHQFELVRYSNI